MSRTATFLALVLSFATGAHAESLADAIGTIARLLKYANHIARGSWPSADFRFDTTTGVPYAFDVWDESLEDAFSGFAVTKFVAIAP
jgi:hypothetical protein